MENYNGELTVNIGTTEERTIKSVVELICKFMDYEGDIVWDTDRPSGQYRKPSCNKKLIELGWNENDYTDFSEGLRMTCEWYTQNFPNVRGIK